MFLLVYFVFCVLHVFYCLLHIYSCFLHSFYVSNLDERAVQANDLPFSKDLNALPDSSVGTALDVQSSDREFESRWGRLFSFAFTFHFMRL